MSYIFMYTSISTDWWRCLLTQTGSTVSRKCVSCTNIHQCIYHADKAFPWHQVLRLCQGSMSYTAIYNSMYFGSYRCPLIQSSSTVSRKLSYLFICTSVYLPAWSSCSLKRAVVLCEGNMSLTQFSTKIKLAGPAAGSEQLTGYWYEWKVKYFAFHL